MTVYLLPGQPRRWRPPTLVYQRTHRVDPGRVCCDWCRSIIEDGYGWICAADPGGDGPVACIPCWRLLREAQQRGWDPQDRVVLVDYARAVTDGPRLWWQPPNAAAVEFLARYRS